MPANQVTPIRLTRGVLANLPPGSYHSEYEIDDDDDSSVEALEEPPEHLRRWSNRDNPIPVESEDEATPTKAEEPLALARNLRAETAREDENTRKRALERLYDSDGDEEDDDYTPPMTPVPAKRLRPDRFDHVQGPSSPSLFSIDYSSPPPLLPEIGSPSTQIPYPPAPGPSIVPSAVVPPTNQPDAFLADVLEVLPDLDPEWATQVIATEMARGNKQELAYRVINTALEMKDGYPKLKNNVKGKAKEKESGAEDGYKGMVYRKKKRLGKMYLSKSLAALEDDFPQIPVPHIRATFFSLSYLYAPAYFLLKEHSQTNPKPYAELKRPRPVGKGKERAARHVALLSSQSSAGSEEDGGAREFKKERAIRRRQTEQQPNKSLKKKRRRMEQGLSVVAVSIKCSSRTPINAKKGICSAAGAQTPMLRSILCMDMTGCQAAFPEKELGRLLSSKSFGLYHRLKQAKELELAKIDGLETCPVCPFAAIVDDPNDKLFRCMNEECGQVTCRKCRNKEHIPKTCEEMEADRNLDKRHAVEDAMSEALIRKCPKCAKPFIKDSGCNKIYCTKCGALSCYICRKAIAGYDHFDQTPGGGQAKVVGRCPLWDGSERRLDDEAILAARDEAQGRARAAAEEEGIQLADEDINVALPNVAQPAGGVAARHMPQVPYAGQLYQPGLQMAYAYGHHGVLPAAIPQHDPYLRAPPAPNPQPAGAEGVGHDDLRRQESFRGQRLKAPQAQQISNYLYDND
nr:uncharacterized protein CI109_007221 [Kwoniella shandongensis]KAA5524429.1 hypothetical protein CI109_007221 [Kwoniella shandongensis]